MLYNIIEVKIKLQFAEKEISKSLIPYFVERESSFEQKGKYGQNSVL